MQNISRRTFLVSAAGVALAACGGGDDDAPAASADTDSGAQPNDGSTEPAAVPPEPTGDLPTDGALVFRQDTSALLTARPQRLVMGVRNSDGSSFRGGPETLDLEITTFDGAPVSAAQGIRHEVDGQTYWTTVATFASEDNYSVVVVGTDLQAAFTARDVASVPIPTVGDQLVPVDTPTASDGRGVDPICTREPACPYHQTNLVDAISGSLPVVLLIGTPAYCQTAICGPVLDDLMAVIDSDGLATAFEVVHAEVYSARWEGAEAPPVAEAVNAFQLSFEPVLYVAKPGGEIVARLDAVWDQEELRAAIALAAG